MLQDVSGGQSENCGTLSQQQGMSASSGLRLGFIAGVMMSRSGTVELAADFKICEIRTQVLVWPVSWAPQTQTVVTVAQCKDDALRSLIAPALIKAMIMVGTPIDAATLNAAHGPGVGAVPPMRLESDEFASVPENSQEFWENGLMKMGAAHQALVTELQDLSPDHDCYQSVAIEWVDRVSTKSLEEIPTNLQEHCRLCDDERLATLAFSHRVRPLRTKWHPPLRCHLLGWLYHAVFMTYWCLGLTG